MRRSPYPCRLSPSRGGGGGGRTPHAGPPRPCRLPPSGRGEGEGRPPMSDSPGFIPQVTVFTCNYCGYMAADTAGALREQDPANLKLVRLPCTGKTDVQYLLDAFEQGADAVLVVGCSLGNCHHVRGNERGRGGGGGARGGAA